MANENRVIVNSDTYDIASSLNAAVKKFIPEMSEGEHSNCGTVSFFAGFILMMILDVSLG